MEKITSRDGTKIAGRKSGDGPPLVLVHGTGAANPSAAWTAVIPTLEEHFSVCAVDRRGRGESGDGDNYAIEREFEDVAAVVDAAGEPVNVLGHSFGGLCALEAGLLTRNIRKLVLYEPLSVPLLGETLYPEGFIDRLQALLETGDREGVLTTFYREVVMMAPHEIERMKSTPAWPERLAAAHTLPREMRVEERYTLDARRFKDLHTPTLLLSGGESPNFIKAGINVVHEALPDSRIVVMPGQQHIAMYTAPDLFLHEVLTFLIGPGWHSGEPYNTRH
jgi:pimeloyl-ACP methyl ester carboxylesterase